MVFKLFIIETFRNTTAVLQDGVKSAVGAEARTAFVLRTFSFRNDNAIKLTAIEYLAGKNVNRTAVKMVSFSETRDLLLLSHSENLIDDEEMLLLYDLNKSKNPVIPYWFYSPFNLKEISDDECKTEFRFFRNDIYRLLRVLRVPKYITCPNGIKVTGIEALCVCLKRFAYPCRYSDLIPRFARDIPQICLISNAMMNHIHKRAS